ncbi:hypothetical protein K4F52_006534 [Lecanicillium sp. MT-2017a]|nr:hypothetical protein K4F52_006534 [Lecanicillium sp. MT-2017a]
MAGRKPPAAVANTQHTPGPTLLPGPIARTVSLATRSTSLAIRLGSLVGGYGLDAARFTTISSLEVARSLVEIVLARAGKDVVDLSKSDLAAAEAETILERSLESLHSAVIQVVFWTSASFRLTGTTLSLASETSQLVLSSLDKLLGSTDSSRAVASIITLIRREFRNPVTGSQGERVGVMDLTVALTALAYLQQACYKLPEEERRRQSHEEVIWDVVVLNDGQRVDVDDEMALQRGYGQFENTDRTSRHGSAEEDEAVLARLKNQIVASLPPDTTVSISNSVTTVQKITVDVDGPQLPTLPTPLGAEIVETSTPATRSKRNSWMRNSTDDTSYRVVYKIERDKFRSMKFQGQEVETGSVVGEIEDSNDPKSPQRPMQYDPTTGTFKPVTEPGSPERPREIMPPPSKITPTTPDRKRANDEDLPEQAANQKKQRTPLNGPHPQNQATADRAGRGTGTIKKAPTKKKTDQSPGRPGEKKTGLKKVLKGSSQSISSMWNKDGTEPSASKARPQWNAPDTRSSNSTAHAKPLPSRPRQHTDGTIANRRALATPEPLPRTSSRASYVSIHERRRDSIVSQTDAYSMQSGALRPASPTMRRTDVSSSHENTLRPRTNTLLGPHVPSSPRRGHGHRKSASYAPSLYSLATNDSQTSLVPSLYYKKSAYSAVDALNTLRREGFVDGTFPAGHLLPNITRYMRFSSACYGSSFMKFLGISNDMPAAKSWDGTHSDVRHFAHHTESDAGNILLASFVDPQGGTDSTGETGTGVPLVHYISLDHEAKAVVLACRGTLGFEDVLADMACDYDNLNWKGRHFKVHKGIHASARRLLYGGDGRVFVTLKAALHEFPDYGLVLCGHSLGGGVTSLLGVMLSEPNPQGTGFVTAAESTYKRMLTDGTTDGRFFDIQIPAGRRIHVYSYGSPGVMSPKLRKVTKGLITSVVHGNDLVPHLSLGILHDFQTLALSFKKKENETKTEIRRRIWAAFQDNVSGAWTGLPGSRIPDNDEEQWMGPALNALRENLRCEKLVPPGEVFIIESQPVLRREAFLLVEDGVLGRPATRVVLKYVKDVEGRFGEVRFGTSMLTDHSPANYERALNKLRLGVVE